MKGVPIGWQPEELAWIEERKEMPRAEAHYLFVRRFERPEVTLKAFCQLCKRKGWMTGRTGGFEKGSVPHNKGKPMSQQTRAKVAATWFPTGNLPHNTRYLGHERVSKDGYVEVSVDKQNPHTGFARRYVLKHVHEWEKANGPVPNGHALKCMDGDRTNCDPANWRAIPRALLPRLAGGNGRGRHPLAFDKASPDLRPAILSVAELEHAARSARRRAVE